MRVVFAGRSVAHFSYFQSIVESLCRRGHKVFMLFDREWSRNYPDDALRNFEREHPKLVTGWIHRRRGAWRPVLFQLRELRSYASYLARPDQSMYYLKRWEGYLPPWAQALVRTPLMQRLLRSESVRATLKRFEDWAPPEPRIVEWLAAVKPDVVIVSPANMRFSEELEYLKAARTLGIPTVVPVLSWDNLTTKGLIHVTPDLLLAWNASHRAEAISIHGVPPDRTAISGSPFFDKWFQTQGSPTQRELFMRKIGLNPDRPYLLYLGSSKNIAKDESWIVQKVVEACRVHPNPTLQSLQFLIRPHPANADIYGRFALSGIVVWPKAGSLPDTAESKADFDASLRHCVATLGVNTTGMIDAVVADKPCLTLLAAEYRHTQLDAAHFKYMLEDEVLVVSHSVEECVARIAEIMEGVDDKRPQRQAFVRKFLRPYGTDRPAGQVAAELIERLAVERVVTGLQQGYFDASSSMERRSA